MSYSERELLHPAAMSRSRGEIAGMRKPTSDVLYANLRTKQIPALDGIRMIAVFLVILYHFGFSVVPGAHGVMIFFVLSGFLITWLLLEEQAASGTISLRDFYRRRTLRIFPAFYAFWCVVQAYELARGRAAMPTAHAWAAFFYVSDYYSALNSHPVNAFSHTWSLGIEEQFYLFWPLVFIWCRGNLRLMTRVVIGIIAAAAVHRLVLVYALGVDSSYIYSAFDTRIDHLLVGCLLAVLLRRRTLQAFWDFACRHPAAPLVPLATVALSLYGGGFVVARYRDVVGFTVEPLLIAVFIAQVVALSATKAWSWLDTAPVRFLGRISYPLYLYQQLTLYPVRSILGGYPVVLQLAAAIAVTVAVASLSYYVVERPFLRLKSRVRVPGYVRTVAA